MTGALPDVHLEVDRRGIPLDEVGVVGLRRPIRVRDAGRTQDTVGDFTVTVSLPARQRGAHLSRLAEETLAVSGPLDLARLTRLAEALARRTQADAVQARVAFPFFLDKKAPASGVRGLVEIGAALGVHHAGAQELEVTVPVTTLCPCSLAISEAGAHNQRSLVTVRVEPRGAVSLAELAAMAEQGASCEVYSVLKRPDEKFVTERAFARPRFVEDVAREVALALRADKRIGAWELEVRSLESIHAHDAIARVRSPRAGSRGATPARSRPTRRRR